MKRYLLFGFDGYYPSGGMNDLLGDFDYIKTAESAASTTNYEYTQILDTATGKVIEL